MVAIPGRSMSKGNGLVDRLLTIKQELQDMRSERDKTQGRLDAAQSELGKLGPKNPEEATAMIKKLEAEIEKDEEALGLCLDEIEEILAEQGA